MTVFTVDVHFTDHDGLRAGHSFTHRVMVMADSRDQAGLLAAQMVATTQDVTHTWVDVFHPLDLLYPV